MYLILCQDVLLCLVMVENLYIGLCIVSSKSERIDGRFSSVGRQVALLAGLGRMVYQRRFRILEWAPVNDIPVNDTMRRDAD